MAFGSSLGRAIGLGFGARQINAVFTVTDASRAGLRSAERSISRFSKNPAMAGLAKSTVAFGKAALGISSALALSAASVADFEKAMAGIAAIMGENSALSDNMQLLRQTAIDLSKEFAFSASEVAEGMRFIAQTGAKTNEILAATRPILELATATMENFDLAAKLTIRTLNAMQLSIQNVADVRRVVNDLQFAVNNSVNTLTSLNDALKFSAPFARTLGIEIEDLVSVLQLTADAGLEAGIAGRSLGQGLQQLIRSGMRGASQEASEFANGLAAMVDRGSGLADIVAELEDRFGGLNSAERAQLETLSELSDAEIKQLETTQSLTSATGSLSNLIQIFGVRGARVFAVLLGQSDRLKELRRNMELGITSAAAQAQVALQNLADQGKRALNQIRAGLLESGFAESLLEQITKLNDSGDLEQFGKRLGELITNIADNFIPAAIDLFTSLLDSIQGLAGPMIALAKLTAGFLQVISGAINPVTAFAGGTAVLVGLFKTVSTTIKAVTTNMVAMGPAATKGATAAAAGMSPLQASLSATNLQLDSALAKMAALGVAPRGALGVVGKGGGKDSFTGGIDKAGSAIGTAAVGSRFKLPKLSPGIAKILKGGIAALVVGALSGLNNNADDPSESINATLKGVGATLVATILLGTGPLGLIVGALLGIGVGIYSLVKANENMISTIENQERIDEEINMRMESLNQAASDMAAKQEEDAADELKFGDSFSQTIAEFENQVAREGGALDAIATAWEDFVKLEFWDGVRDRVDALSNNFSRLGNFFDEFLFGKEGGELFTGDAAVLGQAAGLGTINESTLSTFLSAGGGADEFLKKEADKLARSSGISFDNALELVANEFLGGELDPLRQGIINRIKQSGDALDAVIFTSEGVEATFIKAQTAYEKFTSGLTGTESDSEITSLIEQAINGLDSSSIGSFISELTSDASVTFNEIVRLGSEIELAQKDLRELRNSMQTARASFLQASIAVSEGVVAGATRLAEFYIQNANALNLSGSEILVQQEKLLRAEAAKEAISLLEADTKFKNLQEERDIKESEFNIARARKSIEFQEIELSKIYLARRERERKIQIALFEALAEARLKEIEAANVATEDIADILGLIEDNKKALEEEDEEILAISEIIKERHREIEAELKSIHKNLVHISGNWEDLDAEVQRILEQAGYSADEWEGMTDAQREAAFQTILASKKIELMGQRVSDSVSSAGSLAGALESTRDSFIQLGYSASAVDEALQTLRKIEFQNAVIGFLNNLQSLANATGGDLSLFPQIAALQSQILAGAGNALDDLLSITGDFGSLAEIFARSTTLTQNVQQTTSVNIQAELVFPEGISPEDQEAIAAVAVNALGEAAADSPYYD